MGANTLFFLFHFFFLGGGVQGNKLFYSRGAREHVTPGNVQTRNQDG